MALYDSYLNKNNLYSRPASMMSDVNDYLGANKASLPMDANSLGSLMSNKKFRDDDDFLGDDGGGIPKWVKDFKDRGKDGNGDDGNGDDDDRKDPPPTTQGGGSMLSQFISDLGALDENQQGLLLDFITGGGEHGDTASGVSAEEYAQLFNVSGDYSGRFQGFPQLTNISEDISNVFAYGDQQRGFEQSSAQQAMAAASRQGKSSGRGFSGFGASGRTNALNRRSMMDTLKQRQATIDESVSNKYGTLLSHLQSALRSGFSTAGQILQENPGAEFGNPGGFKVGETRLSGDDLEYWDGSAWVDYEQYMRNMQKSGQG
jgi:hypothetical protein